VIQINVGLSLVDMTLFELNRSIRVQIINGNIITPHIATKKIQQERVQEGHRPLIKVPYLWKVETMLIQVMNAMVRVLHRRQTEIGIKLWCVEECMRWI
jgi:hypothetical protein